MYFNILKWSGIMIVPSEYLERGDAVLTLKRPAPDALVSVELGKQTIGKATSTGSTFDIAEFEGAEIVVIKKDPSWPMQISKTTNVRNAIRDGILIALLHRSFESVFVSSLDDEDASTQYGRKFTEPVQMFDQNYLDHIERDEKRLTALMGHQMEQMTKFFLAVKKPIYFEHLDALFFAKVSAVQIDIQSGRLMPRFESNTRHLLHMQTRDIELAPPISFVRTRVRHGSVLFSSPDAHVYCTGPAALEQLKRHFSVQSEPTKVKMNRTITMLKDACVFPLFPEYSSNIIKCLLGMMPNRTFVFIVNKTPASIINNTIGPTDKYTDYVIRFGRGLEEQIFEPEKNSF